MAVYPAAAAFLLLWLWLSARNADTGILMAVAVIPFGMFAAMVVGGLSLIMANFLAVLSISILLIRWIAHAYEPRYLRFPPSGVYLLVFTLYSVFSGVVLVRLFQGQFLVFPMTVTNKGPQVSNFFNSVMLPLRPTNSNIAQSVYILLSFGFFLATVFVARRRGAEFIEKGLVWAALLNVLLGLFDFLGADAVLSLVRTADYALLNEHLVGPFSRVIGGYAEASAYGAASAVFFTYFFMSYLIGRKQSHGMLAAANFIGALLAMSSTGIAALAAGVLFVALHFRVYLGFRMSRGFGHLLVVGVSFLAIAASAMLLLPFVLDGLSDVMDRLIFSKQDSLSGRERGAWSVAGFDALVQTWGLGAGVGSLRGSGFASVLLGSVGLPGTIAFSLFVITAIGVSVSGANQTTLRLFCAGRVSSMTLLTAMLVSATTPDPTLLLMTTSALCVVAREEVYARNATEPLAQSAVGLSNRL
ncbi:hypothetical protein [Ruegeria arenilitoris]|uniref:hypothetical protein n=1 Tax=Ruegeria arenilitoris TaxID=1173585 RepID=UPI00147B4D00|nr:hypothetical protein [Ruegeria arenilitoris]